MSQASGANAPFLDAKAALPRKSDPDGAAIFTPER
jgi:hypothetical protein